MLNMYDEQERLELEMLQLGRHEFFQKVLKTKEAGRETETPYGQAALKRVYEPMYNALVQWRADAKRGTLLGVVTQLAGYKSPDKTFIIQMSRGSALKS